MDQKRNIPYIAKSQAEVERLWAGNFRAVGLETGGGH